MVMASRGPAAAQEDLVGFTVTFRVLCGNQKPAQSKTKKSWAKRHRKAAQQVQLKGYKMKMSIKE